MKIKFLNSVSSAVGSWGVGSVVDLDPALAMGFVTAEHAELVNPEERAVKEAVSEKATKARK